MKQKELIETFMYGLTIFVLIILAGILTGITLIPITLLSVTVGSGAWLVYVIGFGISIFMLGFIFKRFKVKRK